MKKYKLHIIWAIVTAIALGGGFFWGKSIVASTAINRTGTGRFAFASSTSGGFAGRAGLGAGAGGGFAVGQVASIDSNSLMLQLPNGNSENVYYSSSTQVIIPQPSSISKIKSGTMVMIGGTQNIDGSMTATTIQVRGTTTTQ